MNGKRILVVALLIFALPMVVAAAPPTDREFAPVQGGPVAEGQTLSTHAPGRVMVKLTADAYEQSTLRPDMVKDDVVPGVVTGITSLDALVRELGVREIVQADGPFANRALAERLGSHRMLRFELDAGADVPDIAAKLAADPAVESATPDWRLFLSYVPNDFSYPANWGHDNQAQFPGYDWGGTWDHTGPSVGMPGFDADTDVAWDAPQGFGSSAIIVAIIDTGVDSAHADLLQVAGWDFGDGDGNPHDDSAVAGHGTACAGIAAATTDNVIVAAGVAGNCAIMPLKVADTPGNLWLSTAASAVYFAANNGAHVASMSFSTVGITSDPNMDPALQYAVAQGVTLLASSGNDNNTSVDYPANHADVIAVGAASPCGDRKRSSSLASECNPNVFTDPNGYTCDGERWWGSNYGSAMQDAPGAIDVLAPTILPTTDVTGAAGWRAGDFEPWFNGTSCSAPYAAGVCALILSSNPGLSPAMVRTQLVNSATDVVSIESTPGWDMYSGYGLVNAANAVGGGTTPPVASFTALPTSGCLPLAVAFTDMSTGVVNNWNWDFGDGMVDVVQHPMHTYTAPGTYTVTLNVSGPYGADTQIQTNLITVNPPSFSDFTASVTSGYAPLTTTFVDASLESPTSWNWDFGDGTTSTAQFPSHTYTAPGLYTVILTTSNACGGDIMTKVDYIDVLDPHPHAMFSVSDTLGCAPLQVTFTDASAGQITDWDWTFGDGAADTLQNPTHSYTTAGEYDVRLIVTGPAGVDTMTQVGRVVVDVPPAAAFSANPTTGADTLTVSFTDQSTGSPDTWAWTFGDGGTSTVQNPSHTYSGPGDYTVTLTVTNGCSSDAHTETDMIEVTSTTAVVDVPARTHLGRNYPNPFNPATTIEYGLEREGRVRLEVFDASGRSMAVLVDGVVDAGTHRTVWRPVKGASGVYFARLTVDGEAFFRRMVLLR